MLTTTEAAARLGLTHRSVSRLINQGLIKAEKRGRDWFISEEEIKRYQRERRDPKDGRPRKEENK